MVKQISGLPPGYMEMTYIQSQAATKHKHPTHINAIIRNCSDKKIIVIDTDSQDGYDYITKHKDFIPTAVTKNPTRPGHAHFYYEIDEMPARKIVKTYDNRDIDLIIDNIFERLDSKFNMEPAYIKLDVVYPIFKSEEIPKDVTQTSKSGINKLDLCKSNKESNKHIEPLQPGIKEPQISIDMARLIIEGLDYRVFESYTNWTSFVYCIFNISQDDLPNKDTYFELLNSFLKSCSNYNELENYKFYYQTAHNSENANKISVKSLWYWLKTQNIELYNQLITSEKPIETIDPDYFMHKFKNNYPAAKQYFETLYFKLNNPACYGYYDNVKDEYMLKTESDMAHITQNFWYLYTDEKKTERKLKFFNKWKEDTKIRVYNYIKLVPPPLKCNSNTLNLFTGFRVDKLTDCSIVSIDTILEHIQLLCEDSAAYAEYVINFLAHIIQKPAELTRTALVFKGKQGAGKGRFFNWFADKIIGSKYYYTTGDAANIIQHNDHLNGKLLVNLDETRSVDMYQASSNIKNKITEPMITLQNKYVKPFLVENYSRYVFFSNAENPVKIETSDRRFVVFLTSDRICSLANNDPVKIGYHDRLTAAMENDNVSYSFFKFLASRDISNINWMDRPVTESYRLCRELNIPIFAEFIEKYCVETDCVVFDDDGINITTKAELFTAFNRFLERSKNGNCVMKERTFQIECKKYPQFIVPIQVGAERIKMLQIDRNRAMEYLIKNDYLSSIN